MNTTLTATVISASLFGAVGVGMWARRLLPEHHLNSDTKDTVKLAMGLVATMSALLLGLLVSSAKGAYDTERNNVIQMAAKVAFLERVLAAYGPEAAGARKLFLEAVDGLIRQIWPEKRGAKPTLTLANPREGTVVFAAIHGLSPKDEAQRTLKAQAMTLAIELAQLRSLLVAQSVPSIAKPLLFVVVCWLVAIFISFSLLAPSNATAATALLVSALSVAGAILLILELDRPFGGLIQISNEPLRAALSQASK